MGLLSRGQDFLNRSLTAAAGVPVTVSHNGQAADLVAWVGRTLFAAQGVGASVARATWGDRDYLVPVAAFEAAFGSGAKPGPSDTVTEAGVKWGLSTPTGEPAWRYSDQTRTVFRLHVKRA